MTRTATELLTLSNRAQNVRDWLHPDLVALIDERLAVLYEELDNPVRYLDPEDGPYDDEPADEVPADDEDVQPDLTQGDRVRVFNHFFSQLPDGITGTYMGEARSVSGYHNVRIDGEGPEYVRMFERVERATDEPEPIDRAALRRKMFAYFGPVPYGMSPDRHRQNRIDMTNAWMLTHGYGKVTSHTQMSDEQLRDFVSDLGA